jgi:hypothetical protein
VGGSQEGAAAGRGRAPSSGGAAASRGRGSGAGQGAGKHDAAGAPTAQLPGPLGCDPTARLLPHALSLLPLLPSQPSNETSPACELSKKLAARVLGSDVAGPITGDVLGQAALDKLNFWGTNAIATPDGSRWWALPKNVQAPQLAVPCPSLATAFPEYAPATPAANTTTSNVTAVSAPTTPANFSATVNATAPRALALPRRVGPGVLVAKPDADTTTVDVTTVEPASPVNSTKAPKGTPSTADPILELAKAADLADVPAAASQAPPGNTTDAAPAADGRAASEPSPDVVVIGEADVAPPLSLPAASNATTANTTDMPAATSATKAVQARRLLRAAATSAL